MWLGPLLAVGLVMGAGQAAAQEKRKVRQVVIDEVTRVEGKIQKPEVWYLLPRSNLNFEGLQLDKKLAPKILETTKQDPF
jgi:hypothetical protein